MAYQTAKECFDALTQDQLNAPLNDRISEISFPRSHVVNTFPSIHDFRDNNDKKAEKEKARDFSNLSLSLSFLKASFGYFESSAFNRARPPLRFWSLVFAAADVERTRRG
jgi:hypothetical protein